MVSSQCGICNLKQILRNIAIFLIFPLSKNIISCLRTGCPLIFVLLLRVILCFVVNPKITRWAGLNRPALFLIFYRTTVIYSKQL